MLTVGWISERFRAFLVSWAFCWEQPQPPDSPLLFLKVATHPLACYLWAPPLPVLLPCFLSFIRKLLSIFYPSKDRSPLVLWVSVP